ncbi:hypothetical protein K438DRAFT_1749487 [Mycena galopus ATCC 62051]|nr:hypothetical protein K438DRAFT_1749487 [Mycena galopus ATCC 62051]
MRGGQWAGSECKSAIAWSGKNIRPWRCCMRNMRTAQWRTQWAEHWTRTQAKAVSKLGKMVNIHFAAWGPAEVGKMSSITGPKQDLAPDQYAECDGQRRPGEPSIDRGWGKITGSTANPLVHRKGCGGDQLERHWPDPEPGRAPRAKEERMWRRKTSIDGNVTDVNNHPIWAAPSEAAWAAKCAQMTPPLKTRLDFQNSRQITTKNEVLFKFGRDRFSTAKNVHRPIKHVPSQFAAHWGPYACAYSAAPARAAVLPGVRSCLNGTQQNDSAHSSWLPRPTGTGTNSEDVRAPVSARSELDGETGTTRRRAVAGAPPPIPAALETAASSSAGMDMRGTPAVQRRQLANGADDVVYENFLTR